jgi:sn-glycerol 3-phosphate transport system ATP-binding protein
VEGASAGWKLGVRPEQVEIGDAGLPARIVTVDYLGGETVLRLHLGGQDLFARSNGWSRRKPGNRVCVSWSPDAAHLFDEKGFRRDGHKAVPPASVSPGEAERLTTRERRFHP